MTVERLEASDVSIALGGRPVLAGVNLAASAGEWLAVAGPPGCGKSVLLQVLSGGLEPDEGQVLLDGRPAWRRGDEPPALVRQSYGLVPVHTAAESVALPMLSAGVPRQEIAERTERWLGAVGLLPAADQLVSRLSGGQRQRVAIARALGRQSPVLLLDEPTAELDPDNRDRVIALLRDRAQGSVVVIASHDPAVLGAVDRVASLTEAGTVAA